MLLLFTFNPNADIDIEEQHETRMKELNDYIYLIQSISSSNFSIDIYGNDFMEY